MRHFRPPILLRLLYRKAIFRVPVSTKTVYLTFDDGPTPGQTVGIMNILQQYDVPATFFFCGENIAVNTSLLHIVRDRGFQVANHGMNHISGLSSACKKYVFDILEGEKYAGSQLFRPPYGAISPCQYNKLKDIFKIVFWDIMLYDFDSRLDKMLILHKLEKLIRPGSIIVLHDNPVSNVMTLLEDVIKLCIDRGYSFGDLYGDLIKTA